MTDSEHFRALENMYMAGPINRIFEPRITVTREASEIEIVVKESFFHAAGAVHGAIYFKMLDDAAFFAASSVVKDYFVLTKSFTTHLYRPISSGQMRSVGKVLDKSMSGVHAESIVYDGHGKKLGKGTGVFVKGRMLLKATPGYRLDAQHPKKG